MSRKASHNFELASKLASFRRGRMIPDAMRASPATLPAGGVTSKIANTSCPIWPLSVKMFPTQIRVSSILPAIPSLLLEVVDDDLFDDIAKLDRAAAPTHALHAARIA